VRQSSLFWRHASGSVIVRGIKTHIFSVHQKQASFGLLVFQRISPAAKNTLPRSPAPASHSPNSAPKIRFKTARMRYLSSQSAKRSTVFQCSCWQVMWAAAPWTPGETNEREKIRKAHDPLWKIIRTLRAEPELVQRTRERAVCALTRSRNGKEG